KENNRSKPLVTHASNSLFLRRCSTIRFFLIHTWLQPGGSVHSSFRDTRLKPSVNERDCVLDLELTFEEHPVSSGILNWPSCYPRNFLRRSAASINVSSLLQKQKRTCCAPSEGSL